MFEAVDRVMKNKRGGAVPRRTQIAGQDHMLSYITPTEAEILMQLGGSGKPGPGGIPAFFDVGEGVGGYGSGEEGDATQGTGDPDAGRTDEGTYADDQRGTDDASQQAAQKVYNQAKAITEENPYGFDGFWSRTFGIHPSKISYSNIMSLDTRSKIANNQFSKFVNPTNQPGKIGYNPAFPTAEPGFLRPGVQQKGFDTIFGRVQEDPVARSPRDMAVLGGIGILGGLPGMTISFLADQLTNKTYGLEGLPPPDAAKPGEPTTFAGQAFQAGKQAIGDFYGAAKEAIGDLADFLSPQQAKSVAEASKAEQDRIRAEIEQGIRQGVSSPKMDAEEAFSGPKDQLMNVIEAGTTPAPVDQSKAAQKDLVESLGLASLGVQDPEVSGVPMSGTVPSRTLGSLVDSLPSGRGVKSPSELAAMLGTAGTTGGTGTFSGGFGSGDGPDERVGDGPPPDDDSYFYDPTTTGGYFDYGTFGPFDDRVVIPTEEVLKERFNLVI